MIVEPLSVLAALGGAVKGLYEIASKVKENREQCVRLCLHITSILDVIDAECKDGLPPRLAKRMIKLTSALLDLTVTLEGLHKSSFLQRVIWRDQIATKIQELYKDIFEAVQDLKLGIAFDVSKVQQENENARQEDAATAKQNFDRLLSNDQEILGELEVHKQQMQEAIVCLHRYLEQLPDSVERRYLENGMHALQRRSGPLRIIPDVFVITSLDVIIHDDKKLGQGGFTSVYEAHWRGTKVAVKVMDRGVPASAIEREVDVWKRLRHPHILEFFGACSIADPPFMVCAYKQNGDAVDYLRRFPNANRLQLLYEAALGLAYLHANGVVHGDIKASNILIDQHGKACLSDFGLSQIKIHTTSIRWGSGNTPPHGTARWMSPEHMTVGVTNKRTDVYSFGMTMYEVFTDSPPFAATPENMLLPVICDRGIRPSRPEDPAVEKNGLNDEIWGVMTRTWAQQPERRPQAPDILSMLTRHTALVSVDIGEGVDFPVTKISPISSVPVPSKTGPTHSRTTTVASASSTASSTYSAQRMELRIMPESFSPTSSTHSLGTMSSGRSLVNTPKSSDGIETAAQNARHLSSPSHKPYVSAGAQELIDFLDEGPLPDEADVEDESEYALARKHDAPQKRTLGLPRLPKSLTKLARKRDSLDARSRKQSIASMPSSEGGQSSRSTVTKDVQELIDFLDEGPGDDDNASLTSLSPRTGPAFLRTLGRRPRLKDVDVAASRALPTTPLLLEPQSPGSASDRSSPYISQSARELVAFLDEGPPPALRRHVRDGSTASSEVDSPSSARRIRDMFMRRAGASDGPEPSPRPGDRIGLPDRSRRASSASSVDPFLPLPLARGGDSSAASQSQDDSGSVLSELAEPHSVAQAHAADARAPPSPHCAGEPSRTDPASSSQPSRPSSHALGTQESNAPSSQSPRPPSDQAHSSDFALPLRTAPPPRGAGVPQPEPGGAAPRLPEAVGAAAPYVVVLSTLALYMLLFAPVAA